MISKKVKNLTFLIFLLFTTHLIFAQNQEEEQNSETLEKGIMLLEKYFVKEQNWHVLDNNYSNNIQGLIQFIQAEPIDSILMNLNSEPDSAVSNFVNRLPENVSDSLSVPGYYPFTTLKKDVENLGAKLKKEYQKIQITLPMDFITEIESKVKLVQPGEGIKLFIDSVYMMPASLFIPDVIPDSMLNSPADFQRILKTDSLRSKYIEKKRKQYNDSIVRTYRDSVIYSLRQEKFKQEFGLRKKRMTDSISLNNYTILHQYNDSIVKSVNDSISIVLKTLVDYANFIDTTHLHISNLTNKGSEIVLRNNSEHFTRIWLKNEQKDSLSVLVKNLDKRSVQMLIDDGVTFNRFSKKESKDFDFSTLNKTVTGLTKVGQKYEQVTPWIIGGDGNMGFTQTYLENWKKGGKSALSFLLVLKGFANYSRADGKVKWENSGEIRNGWIRPGGSESELQKNDDKFELTTRFGVSAFKKWYYSGEMNYETQFFRGFNYPTSNNPDPISAFMGPSRTFFKVGLDYKPNKEFSLFLSPLTVKNVFVKDTVLIDQTKFGVAADKKSFWEPGLNADLKYKKEITKSITYETKYKMFINYKQPFKKFDINWENLLVTQLSDYINMHIMVHMIYDDNVLFPVYDANNTKIGEEAKLQLKQFISLGFSYKINRKITKAKKVN